MTIAYYCIGDNGEQSVFRQRIGISTLSRVPRKRMNDLNGKLLSSCAPLSIPGVCGPNLVDLVPKRCTEISGTLWLFDLAVEAMAHV